MFWLLYRKMYAWAIASIVVSYVANLIVPVATWLVMAILFGLLGNRLYMYHIDRLAGTYFNLPETERAAHVKRRGGTSGTAVVIALVIYFASVVFSWISYGVLFNYR